MDLKNIIIKYLPCPTDDSIGNAVIFELVILEKDIKDHSRIEDKILVPKLIELEKLHKQK